MIYYLLSNITRFFLAKLRKYHTGYPKILVYTKDFIGEEIYAFGLYEKGNINIMLNCLDFPTEEHSILDVGANIGNHTLQFSKHFKEVYAFEPNLLAFDVLKLNTVGIQNIKLFNYGLSNKNGEAFLKIPEYNIGGATVVNERDSEKNKILLKKGDDVINFPFAVMKMDIEGHELKAIEGLAETLIKHKPILFLEFLNKTGTGDMIIINLLKNLGYTNFYEPYKKTLLGSRNNGYFFEFINGLFFVQNNSLKKIEAFKKENYTLLVCENPTSEFKVEPNFVKK
ncbi:MAG: FkbM family methyltransferase [Flavobacteriaceae bacterium]